MVNAEYPCPCCGYLVFTGQPGSYDICPICYWEDDAMQLEFATTLDAGPNHSTLADAQIAFAIFGASDARLESCVRAPGPDDRRDPEWRPVDSRIDDFEDWAAEDPKRAPEYSTVLYYWRSTFWRARRTEG